MSAWILGQTGWARGSAGGPESCMAPGLPCGAGTPYGASHGAGAPLWGALQDTAPLQGSVWGGSCPIDQGFSCGLPQGTGLPV